MHPNQPFLSSYVIVASAADLGDLDCSGLEEGQIAVVTDLILTPNADPAGNPFFVYLPTSAVAVGAAVVATANSQSAVLPGRWVQLTATFA